jgi:wobble nucleotide-excising tRNase
LIKGIAKIKGLGVYEDYTKPNDTKDFGVKNLIYGWNYSGKTTLSRLFSLLESKTANPDLKGCSFSFETDGEPITDANYHASGLIVRVFNSDFIRDNLHFGGEDFKPVLLLGKDSDVAQKKIDHMG